MSAPAVAGTPEVSPPDVAGGSGNEHTGTALRVVSHLAAELPLVVLGVVELARGWRPLYDNADLALRSFQVLSSRSPLVGHEMAVTAGSHAVFGPGPIQNWLLALPVRLDPAQGLLWGSLVAVVLAVALAIEAAWAVARWRGAMVAAGSVLVLVLARTDVALDVAWNVWFGLFYLITAVATGLAVATGRFRWWPITVVTATVVVQCHAAFAPPAVAVCLVAPVVGAVGVVARGEHRRIGSTWLLVGLVVGAALWAAPLAQEATTRPGNLTLLVRAARESGPTIGWSAALHAFGGAAGVPPSWAHPSPPPGAAMFFSIAGTFAGPAWWGVLVFVLLSVVATVAWRADRPALAAMALLTLTLSVGAVAAIGSVPSSQFLVVGYLGALWVPVSTAVWVTFAWAVGELAAGASRRRRGAATAVPPEPGGHGWERPVGAAAAVLLVLASTGVVWRGLDRMDGTDPTLGGWPAVHATTAAADAASRVAPHGPFRLEVAGPRSADHFAVVTGVAYLLTTRGLDPRPDSPVAYATFGRPPSDGPTVVLTLPDRGGRAAARLVRG